VKGLRNRTRIADDAVRVFQGLLDVMDEIQGCQAMVEQ